MKVNRLSKNCIEIRNEFTYKSGQGLKVFLASDTHHDSKKSHLSLLKQHLDEAQGADAPIFLFGDVLDLMGHHRDPRTTIDDLKESLRVTNYFQQVIDEAFEFFRPYAKNIICMADGNHETNILSRHSINILSNLCFKLELETKEKVEYMPSDGWIRFKFSNNGKGSILSSTLFYNHFGNGGRRSKGVLGADLRQADVEADIYVTGHNHMKWTVPQSRLYLNSAGKEIEKRKLHINLGCYKQNETGGYGRTKHFYTTNLGGYFLEFILKSTGEGYKLYNRAIEAI